MAKKIILMIVISVLLSVLATIVVNKLKDNCPLCKEEESEEEETNSDE